MRRNAEQIAYLEDRIERAEFLLACALDAVTRRQLEACLQALEQQQCRLAREERVLEAA